jgi:hypothetical protein
MRTTQSVPKFASLARIQPVCKLPHGNVLHSVGYVLEDSNREPFYAEHSSAKDES